MTLSGLRSKIIGALFAFAAGTSADAAAPEARLHWNVAPNPEIFGFNVYRATQRIGPFVRVNKDIVQRKADMQAGEDPYVFVDRDVISGRTYYYYIDALRSSGVSERLSGTLSKTIP